MQQFDVKGGIDVTAKIKAQMDESPIANPPPAGMDGEGMKSFMDAASSSADSLKENSALFKEFGNIMPEIVKNLRYMNQLVANTNRNLPSFGRGISAEKGKDNKKDELMGRELLQIVRTGSGMAQSVANGNVAGVVQRGLSGAANLAGDVAGLMKLVDMAGLSKGALIAGGLASAAVAIAAATNEFADKFIEAMPTVYGTGKAFGTTDDTKSRDYFSRINSYNKGTGLDIDSFQAISQSLRKQGVGNGMPAYEQIGLVGSIAGTTSRWAYATNGDANQYAELAGMMSRYGGSNDVAKDFNYIVSAGKASGLGDTQIPEFLAGIQKVMEEGIAKGFATSATEVADTLLMFSKLSGNNPFWQGEQGAKLLNRANSGIASATSLSKTEDIFVYAAMKDAYTDEKMREILGKQGSYAVGAEYSNVMQMIERGIRPENFDNIMGYITTRYSSPDDQIEALRGMTGLNYEGASQLRNLGLNALNGKEVSYEKLKDILSAPENQNKETRYHDAVNTIKDSVVRIGSGAAALKIIGMEHTANNVKRIVDFLVPDKTAKEEAREISANLSDRQAALANRNSASYRSSNDIENRDNLLTLSAYGDFARMPAEMTGVFKDYWHNTEHGRMPYWEIDAGFDSDDRTSMNEFLRSGFNSRLKYIGADPNTALDDSEVNAFLKNLLYDNLESYERLKTKVQEYDNDGVVNGSEQDSIYNLLKTMYAEYKTNGITLYQSR